MAWVMNQLNESTTRYRTRSSYSMLSLATTLTCSHDCMLEHAGGWTTICCERGDRVEPFGTAGAKGRAPRKAPAKPLPRGEGWEDRSRPLALLQLGLMLAHFVGVCRVRAARCDEFLQAGAQLCAVKTREGNYITIRLMLIVAVKQEEGSYPTERRGRISPHDRKN